MDNQHEHSTSEDFGKREYSVNYTFSQMADACIACAGCTASCPVTNADGEYVGPKLIGPAQHRLAFAEDDLEKTLKYCTNCKTCDRTCSAGVKVSTINMLVRGKYYDSHPHKIRDMMLSNHSLASHVFRSIPFGSRVANFMLKIARYCGIFNMLGVTRNRKLPSYSPDSFTDMLLDLDQAPKTKKVVLFQGCFIEHNAPWVGMDFVKVMEKNGYEVLRDEKFVCCGSPLVSSGYLEKAWENSVQNAKRILYWQRKKIPVVACCTSCSLVLKEEAGELFDDELLFQAGTNVYDAFEFIKMLQNNGELVNPPQKSEETLLYHVPCHLLTQGIGAPAKEVLEDVGGMTVKVLDAGCCGMAGSYGYQSETAKISLKIGEELFNRIKEKPDKRVISDCATCRMQISYATKRETLHPIEILADLYEKK